MNSIENYKIFYSNLKNKDQDKDSCEDKIINQCQIFFEENSLDFQYLIYCKQTQEILKSNIDKKKLQNQEINYTSDIFQDDFVLITNDDYLVNISSQNQLVLIKTVQNQQILEQFYQLKKQFQARLENNEINKIINEFKEKYIENEDQSELLNEQVYFDTEINTQQNKKIFDKLEEESQRMSNRKKFLRLVLIIGVLGFMFAFFTILKQSYFQKVNANSIFKKRNVFNWSQTKNKTETQKFEKLRKNLFIEDKGSQNKAKLLKKSKRHRFKKSNFDF